MVQVLNSRTRQGLERRYYLSRHLGFGMQSHSLDTRTPAIGIQLQKNLISYLKGRSQQTVNIRDLMQDETLDWTHAALAVIYHDLVHGAFRRTRSYSSYFQMMRPKKQDGRDEESKRLRCYRDLAANTKSKPATYARQGYRRMGCIESYKVEQPRSESEASMGDI